MRSAVQVNNLYMVFERWISLRSVKSNTQWTFDTGVHTAAWSWSSIHTSRHHSLHILQLWLCAQLGSLVFLGEKKTLNSCDRRKGRKKTEITATQYWLCYCCALCWAIFSRTLAHVVAKEKVIETQSGQLNIVVTRMSKERTNVRLVACFFQPMVRPEPASPAFSLIAQIIWNTG